MQERQLYGIPYSIHDMKSTEACGEAMVMNFTTKQC